jgi:hypothetical protein
LVFECDKKEGSKNTEDTKWERRKKEREEGGKKK